MAPSKSMVDFDFKKAARAIELLAAEANPQNQLVRGLRVIGEEIKTDVAFSRPGAGVPKDIGTLAATLRVVGPDLKGVVLLVAGGASASYALTQHERLDYSHDNGEARYWIRGVERWVAGQAPGQTMTFEQRMTKIMNDAIRDVKQKSGA